MTPRECRTLANEVIDQFLERTGAKTTEEVACYLGMLVGNSEVRMHFICGADFTERAMAAAKVAASMQIQPDGLTATLFREHIRQAAAGTPPANDPKAPQ